MKAFELYLDDGNVVCHFANTVEHRVDDTIAYFFLMVVGVGRHERTRQVIGIEISFHSESLLFLAFEDRNAYVERGREVAIYLLGDEKTFITFVRIELGLDLLVDSALERTKLGHQLHCRLPVLEKASVHLDKLRHLNRRYVVTLIDAECDEIGVILQLAGHLRAVMVGLVDDERDSHLIAVHDDVALLLVDSLYALIQLLFRRVDYAVDFHFDGFVERQSRAFSDFERFDAVFY